MFQDKVAVSCLKNMKSDMIKYDRLYTRRGSQVSEHVPWTLHTNLTQIYNLLRPTTHCA